MALVTRSSSPSTNASPIEHIATWPMVALVDRYHPTRKEPPKLAAGCNRLTGSLRPQATPFR